MMELSRPAQPTFGENSVITCSEPPTHRQSSTAMTPATARSHFTESPSQEQNERSHTHSSRAISSVTCTIIFAECAHPVGLWAGCRPRRHIVNVSLEHPPAVVVRCRQVGIGALEKRDAGLRLRKTLPFSAFHYFCPEPVLANLRGLVVSYCAKRRCSRTQGRSSCRRWAKSAGCST